MARLSIHSFLYFLDGSIVSIGKLSSIAIESSVGIWQAVQQVSVYHYNFNSAVFKSVNCEGNMPWN